MAGYVPYITRPSTPTLILYPRNDGANTSAFTNYYSSDPDRIPGPTTPNNTVNIYCRKPFTVKVDWGDGVKEEFNSVGSSATHRVSFRGLRTYSSSGEENGYYNPSNAYYDNHFYGKYQDYVITMVFSEEPVNLTVDITCWRSFPNIGMYELQTLSMANIQGVSEIPSDRISKLKNLTSLRLAFIVQLQQLPESISGMTKLTGLDISSFVNFSDPDASNLRNLKYLVNLTGTLSLPSCSINTITSEMVNLPKINSVSIGSSSLSKKFNPEITEFPSNITSMSYLWDLWGTTKASMSNDPWKENITKIRRYDEVIRGIYSSFIVFEHMLLPPYVYDLYNLSSVSGIHQFPDQAYANEGVNKVYELTTSNSNVTMTSTKRDGTRNQFYNLTFSLYDSVRSVKVRPSGDVIAPPGFVLGSSNGTPTTPGQKLYCLINNYKQVWNICPESALPSSYSTRFSNEEIEEPSRYDVIIVNGIILSIEPDTSVHKSDLLLDPLYNNVETFSIRNKENGELKLSDYLLNETNRLIFNSYFNNPIIPI